MEQHQKGQPIPVGKGIATADNEENQKQEKNAAENGQHFSAFLAMEGKPH
jgi:hypothetical protein